MDPVITPEMLAMTGIVVADEQLEEYLEHLNDVLTERIGEAITDTLSDEQIDEVSALQETATDEVLTVWLQKNVTDMDAIIQDEIDILLGEAADNSDTINELDKE